MCLFHVILRLVSPEYRYACIAIYQWQTHPTYAIQLAVYIDFPLRLRVNYLSSIWI